MLHKLKRLTRTLSPLKASQLVWYGIRRGLKYPRNCNLPSTEGFRNLVLEKPTSTAYSYLGGARFQFLNAKNDASHEINWEATTQTMLWRYNLHYFDYLRQNSMDTATTSGLLLDWIKNVEPFESVGWQPYPTSLRLVNWSFYLAVHADQSASDIEQIHQSYLLQTAWLAKNLEYHIQANHLFENIKALLFAGAFLEGEFGKTLIKKSQKLLRKELAEQFLPDGFHYEKTPMYHATMTCGLLDIYNLVSNNSSLFESGIIDEVTDKATKALDALAKIMPPDQSIPFFNDSVNGIAPTYEDLIEYATRLFNYCPPKLGPALCLHELENAGYYVAQLNRDMAMVDCGNIGPAYQPGHTHCDMLSYEVWLDGVKIITNCGNYDYENSVERRYSRSTAAHNTVEIDGQEQSEIWGAFRVGRRAKVIESRAEKTDDNIYFAGAHDGYRYLRGKPIHRRQIEFDRDSNFKVTDEIKGEGKHVARSFIHIASGFSVYRESDSYLVRNAQGESVLALFPDQAHSVEVTETARYPEFGIKENGSSIIITHQAAAPFAFGYRVQKTTP